MDRPLVLICALVVFAFGINWSIQQEPELVSQFSIFPALIFAFLFISIIQIIGSIELILCTRLAKREMSLSSAITTTIIATAANMLPIPGAAIVKVMRFRSLGISYSQSMSLTILMIIIWMGTSFMYSGIWMMTLDINSLGVVFSFSGLLILASSAFLAIRKYENASIPAQLVSLRFTMVLVESLLLMTCFDAIGVKSGLSESSVITLSGFVGSAVFFVPAGLGIKELVAGGLAPLVGISIASAYLTSSLSRIIGMMMIFPVALILIARQGGINPSAAIK